VHSAPDTLDAPAPNVTPFHPLPAPAPGSPPPSDLRTEVARAQLGALLTEAGALPVTDDPAWDRLRTAASAAVDALVVAGVLPAHLRLCPSDAPVAVARTVATAWRWSEAS
jgi:hypothetical protein